MSIAKAPAVATTEAPAISTRCGTRDSTFCVDTADEYTFANASSVSSTVSARSASAAAAPPPAIAVRISSGWFGSTPAREHEDRAEAELEQRREQVADPDAEERAPPVAREARVVGDERRPRDRDRDHRVDREPERAVVRARVRPEVAEVRAVDDPPREVGDREGDRPDRELAHEAADEADRPEQRQRGGEPAEEELPRPGRVEPEQLVAEQPRGGRDHDQLEDRPAEALRDVEHRRDVRAALPERSPLEHHRRHAPVRADQRSQREHRVPDQPADERRRERVLQRQVEVGRQHEHEQRDAEVDPEQRRVDEAEHAKPLRHGLDSPGWRFHTAPFAGPNQIRFDGSDLSRP